MATKWPATTFINTTDLNMTVAVTMRHENATYDTQTAICSSGGECLHIFLIPIICVFGIIGNLCSFKVFVFTSFGRRSSGIFLAALSLSDTGFLLSLFLSWLGGGQLGTYFKSSIIYCNFVVYVTYVCSFLSVWYIVLLMVERYMVVCYPLKFQIWCSKRRSMTCVVGIAVFALLFYSQTFFTSAIRDNECSINLEYRALVVVITYVDTIFTFVFPIVLVMILNIIIIISIRMFRKQQVLMVCFQDDKLTKAPNRLLSTAEFRITRMLIVVSSMFIITNLPSHAVRLYIMIFPIHSNANSKVVGQIQLICNLLYFCNFAINFLLYSSTSKIFRKFLCIKSTRRCSSGASSRSEHNKYFGTRPNGTDKFRFLYVRKISNSPV